LELATPEERARILEKERQTKEFFSAMEANILRKVNQGIETHDVQTRDEDVAVVKPSPHRRNRTPMDVAAPVDYIAGEESKYKAYPEFWGAIRGAPTSKPPRMVRTISHMDDSVLEQLKTTENSDLSAREARSLEDMLEDISVAESEAGTPAPGGPRSMQTAPIGRKRHIMSSWFGGDKAAKTNASRNGSRLRRHSTVQTKEMPSVSRTTRVSLETIDLSMNPPPLRRNNSTSTIYVNETMAAPDKDATIKAVCCVIRAHMLSAAARDDAHTLDTVPAEFKVFIDRDYERPKPKRPSFSRFVRPSTDDEVEVPKLDTIVKFFRHVYLTAQMEVECIIMSLIYVEKLLKETSGGLQIRHFNWKSILFAGMIMASKVWDDLSMWNVDFSAVCPTFSLHRINQLELTLLDVLKFNTTIPASVYAKYYFHLRSMCVAMGLGGDLRSIQPLSIEDAQRLHICSARYGDKNNLSVTVRTRASTLTAPLDLDAVRPPLDGSAESHLRKTSQTKPRLSLEEVLSVSPTKASASSNSLVAARGATP